MRTLRDPDEDLITAEVARALEPFTNTPGDVHAMRRDLMHLMWD